jgi:hypothetical protein
MTTKVASQHFGVIELNHGRDHNIAAEHELAGRRLELDLNINAHDHFDEAAMHKVDYRLRYLPELVDEVREMIAEELEQEGTSPQEYLRFHCNAIKDEHLQKVFGVKDKSQLTNAVFLKALKLGHVGIYPGQPERYFVLDFTLGSTSRTRSWSPPQTRTASSTTRSSGNPESIVKARRRPSPFR